MNLFEQFEQAANSINVEKELSIQETILQREDVLELIKTKYSDKYKIRDITKILNIMLKDDLGLEEKYTIDSKKTLSPAIDRAKELNESNGDIRIVEHDKQKTKYYYKTYRVFKEPDLYKALGLKYNHRGPVKS